MKKSGESSRDKQKIDLQSIPENVLPRWVPILDKLIEEAQAST